MTTPSIHASLLLLTVASIASAAQVGDPPAPPPQDAPHAGPPDGAGGPPSDGPPPFLSMFEWDPGIERGLQLSTARATPGLTYVEPLNGTRAYLIDLDGTVVHEWQFDSAPGAWAYLMDDGSLLRAGRVDRDPAFRGGGIGGRLERIAPDGTVLWRYQVADENLWQHHDIEPLPNGNLLVIAWERIPRETAIAHGRDPEWVGAAGLWTDVVLELRPLPPDDAEVVWRWRAWDHMVQDFDPEAEGYGDVADAAGRIDVNADVRAKPARSLAERREEAERLRQLEALGYTGGVTSTSITVQPEGEEARAEREAMLARSGDMLHTNAVDHLPELDLIVLSSPELNEVFVIDHSTTTAEAASSRGGRFGRGGDLLWRWGNPRTWGTGDEGDQQLWYQHDPELWLADDGTLRLCLFNNGGGRDEDGPGWSSVDVLRLPFDPERGFVREPGTAFGPSAPEWSWSDPERFFSAFISGVERLESGNVLVCSGAGGRLFELTPEGEVVWDYRNPFGGDVDPPDHAGKAPPLALFRPARYAPDHPGIRALLEAGRQ